MSDGSKDDHNIGHKNQAAIDPIDGRPRAAPNLYKNIWNFNIAYNSNARKNHMIEVLLISPVQLPMLSPFLSSSLPSLLIPWIPHSVISLKLPPTKLRKSSTTIRSPSYLITPAYELLLPHRPFYLTVISRPRPFSLIVIYTITKLQQVVKCRTKDRQVATAEEGLSQAKQETGSIAIQGIESGTRGRRRKQIK